MRSVSFFFEKFTSGSRISASRSDLLKLPINELSLTGNLAANFYTLWVCCSIQTNKVSQYFVKTTFSPIFLHQGTRCKEVLT